MYLAYYGKCVRLLFERICEVQSLINALISDLNMAE